MIAAIYKPIVDAILLADTEKVGSIEIPMAEARAIAETIARADVVAARAREMSVPSHLARWPRGMRP